MTDQIEQTDYRLKLAELNRERALERLADTLTGIEETLSRHQTEVARYRARMLGVPNDDNPTSSVADVASWALNSVMGLGPNLRLDMLVKYAAEYEVAAATVKRLED